jgi:hypothetical protein
MAKPMIAIPTVLPEEVEQLADLRRQVRRVHKSVPDHSPIRQVSADLSERLQRLHRRGVPLHMLADIVGLSHQAVRVRVRSAPAPPTTGRSRRAKPPTSVNGAPKLTEPAPGLALVADAGVHRRLHVFDPPEDAGPAYLSMIPSIPLLEDQSAVLEWLESESSAALGPDASVTATRLRMPPAVYLPRGMVDSVLVPLTTQESRSGDAEPDSDPAPGD